MFDHASRYANIGTTTMMLPDGRMVSYVRRRFLPRGGQMALLAEVQVAAGERIDLISNRTLGDPLAFWRICDANDAMDPQAMVAEVAADANRLLRIPLPQG
ncbi:conserved hypothetical protein [Bradyrhizobium sp. ORS 278]|uniref:hypothetical protein n=1 Tax=Bradyrhizobium sp. (strain ORS 278) TaxID=114615 RepID=UPI0001508158|nr:hypothetical protein [Bradyrhizobium sp. ORS 278]CAL78126.1 conserved hypothetical protein [Bradyrhizobium sp. ORS 278]